MRSLRAALLCAWAASAASAAVVSNVQAVVCTDGGCSFRATMPGGGSTLQWRWSEAPSTALGYYGHSGNGGGTGTRFGVVAPGGPITFNMIPVLDGDTSYNCSTDPGFNATPVRTLNGGSMSCVGPHIQVTLPSATSYEPVAPTGNPTPTVPAITGLTLTATSCAEVATHMATICGSGAHADDGQPDAVVAPWNLRCHSTILTQDAVCQNDDVKVLKSSRSGTPWCAYDNAVIDPSYQDECTPHFRPAAENQHVISFNAGTGTGGWMLSDVLVGMPTLDSGVYSELAKISTVADDTGDKLITTDGAHGIDDPGVPGGAYTRVRIFGCTETDGTSLNGNRAYTRVSTTQLRITGASGLACSGSSAYVVRETVPWTTANPILEDTNNAQTVGLNHIIIDQTQGPGVGDATWVVLLRGDDSWVYGSYWNWGNFVPHNGVSETYGRYRSANNMSAVGVMVDGAVRSTFRKVKARGAGLAWMMGDSSVGVSSEKVVEGVWAEVLDFQIDTSLEAGLDRVTGVDLVGRQAIVEMKREVRSRFTGTLAANFPQLMGSSNAVMNSIFLRSLPNGNETGEGGSSDALIEHFVCYKMPACIAIEGHQLDVGTELGAIEGRYKIDNGLVAFSQNLQTTAPGHTSKWGIALELIRTATKTTAQHVTVYKPDAGRGPFYSHRSTGSGVRLDKWAVFGLGRLTGLSSSPDLFYHVSEGGVQEPRSDQVSDAVGDKLTAADAFARAYRVSASESYVRNSIFVGGQEASGGAWDSTTTRVDTNEVASELTGGQTGYNFSGITNATSNSPTTIDADIAACDVQADYSLGTPGGVCLGAAGDEGVDPVALRRKLMALESHSSETKPLAIAANGSNDGFRIRYGVPDTADTVRVSWRGRDAVTVPADAGTGFAFADGGGSDDTITRHDGGSWIADGYCVGCWVEIAGATVGGNSKTVKIVGLTATVLNVQSTAGGDAGLTTSSGDNTAQFFPAWAWVDDSAQTGVRDRQVTISGLAVGSWYRLRVEAPMQILYRTATP